jgi:hypothetical protein
VSLCARAKGSTGHYRHLFFLEQALGKLHRGPARQRVSMRGKARTRLPGLRHSRPRPFSWRQRTPGAGVLALISSTEFLPECSASQAAICAVMGTHMMVYDGSWSWRRDLPWPAGIPDAPSGHRIAL